MGEGALLAAGVAGSLRSAVALTSRGVNALRGGGLGFKIPGSNSEIQLAKYIEQGISPVQAEYLATEYQGMGHHFVPRRLGYLQ